MNNQKKMRIVSDIREEAIQYRSKFLCHWRIFARKMMFQRMFVRGSRTSLLFRKLLILINVNFLWGRVTSRKLVSLFVEHFLYFLKFPFLVFRKKLSENDKTMRIQKTQIEISQEKLNFLHFWLDDPFRALVSLRSPNLKKFNLTIYCLFIGFLTARDEIKGIELSIIFFLDFLFIDLSNRL